jgi:L-ascorbate metabolism protein UlaG (beta-lactamase superfamily)
MKIQRLSTASYKFFSPQGKVVVVDPWLTNDSLWPLIDRTPEKLKEIDVMTITHAHFDHASAGKECAICYLQNFITNSIYFLIRRKK